MTASATPRTSSSLFRDDAADLRFRSGDHALRLWGDAPSLDGQVQLPQRARLVVLTIPGTVRAAPAAARALGMLPVGDPYLSACGGFGKFVRLRPGQAGLPAEPKLEAKPLIWWIN